MSARAGSGPTPRLIDRRSPPAWLAARIWRRQEPDPFWARALDALTGGLNRAAVVRRVAARGAPTARSPLIVSVGNLSVGGAGKTPLVAELAAALAARGVAGAIAVRGWGSPARGPLVVHPGDAGAGDEARLLSAAAPGWTVVQAADRAAGLARALQLAPPAAVVVLEDGHQSAGTARHLDVLILERWSRDALGRVRPGAGPRLPWGPWREGVEGARRAAVWLVETDDAALPRDPAPDAGGRPGTRVLPFVRRCQAPAGFAPPAAGAWAAVSGVARPEAFERDASRLCGRQAALVVRHDDHHPYRGADVRRLLRAGDALSVEAWLTTAKDAVKLRSLWPAAGPPLIALELSVAWPGTETLPDLVGERLAEHGRGA